MQLSEQSMRRNPATSFFFFFLSSRQEVTVGQILLSPADFKYGMLKMK